MFNLDHIIWLILSAVAVGLLTFFSVKKKWSFKRVAIIAVIVALASETFKIATHMFPCYREDFLGAGAEVSGFSGAMYLLPKSLPFHLCSILIFFIFFMSLSKNEKLIEKSKTFCVPIFLLAGSLAIIINTAFNKDINNFESFTGVLSKLDTYRDTKDALDLASYLSTLSAYQYFPYHAMIIWYGLYLMITKQVKFGLKEWLTNDIILFALFIGAIWINSLTLKFETNFMFVAAPPSKGLPLLNLNHGWYVYIIHYMLIAAILTFLFQLPFMVKEWKAKKAKVA